MIYLRHKRALLAFETKITDLLIEKHTWIEISDAQLIGHYQKQVNDLEFEKEVYLNKLLQSLQNTPITLDNVLDVKLCYELLEVHSKFHYSKLFKKHLNKTIEDHQKKYGDLIIRTHYKKANEVEILIKKLEEAA